MDRRRFLEVLGAVGVLAGGARLLPPLLARELQLPDEIDLSDHLSPGDLAVYGRPSGRTFEFFASYDGTSGPIVTPELRRFDGTTLLRFDMAPDSFVRWSATRDEEIYGPIKISMPEGVSGYVIGTDNLGRIVMANKDGVVPLVPS